MDATTPEQVSAHVDATNKLLADLSAKLQAAADAGDGHARAWQLDLREIALSSKESSMLAANLARSAGLLSGQSSSTQSSPAPFAPLPGAPQFQADFSAPAPASPYAAPPSPYAAPPSPYAAPPAQHYQQPHYNQPEYQQPQYYQQPQHNQGGMFSRFRNSSLGSNMINAVGWGFGFRVGEDLVEGVEEGIEDLVD